MKRGDLVTVALQGDLGQPRPALVIQSDFFDAHPSITVLPVTSEWRDAPLLRVAVEPAASNGLHKPSQVMVDKAVTLAREKIGASFGQLDADTVRRVERRLAVFLGITK